MGRESSYFSLSLEALRAIGSWAADCAERALPVYEKHAASDSRPRAAIEGIRVFAGGEKRTARLRSLAMEALSAAREAGDPAAAAAARAACLAASSAFTHPLADVQQTKHIVGPAAYAALALELDQAGDPSIDQAGDPSIDQAGDPSIDQAGDPSIDQAGDPSTAFGEVRWAIEHAPPEVGQVLRQMPARQAGKSRLDTLLYELDAGIRARTLPQDA